MKRKQTITFLAAVSILLVLIFIISVFIDLAKNSKKTDQPKVKINDNEIEVEIADDEIERYQGLSDRSALCPDCGMLFLFEDKVNTQFVMRRMHFPLDLIWISDGIIVKIDRDLTPEGEQPSRTYSAGKLIDTVLEVNGGYTDSHQIKVGDKIEKFIYN